MYFSPLFSTFPSLSLHFSLLSHLLCLPIISLFSLCASFEAWTPSYIHSFSSYLFQFLVKFSSSSLSFLLQPSLFLSSLFHSFLSSISVLSLCYISFRSHSPFLIFSSTSLYLLPLSSLLLSYNFSFPPFLSSFRVFYTLSLYLL